MMPPLPMVCRENELRVIEEALANTRAGRGGALFVIGESGIGKSRLSAAAANLGAAAGMCVIRGRASRVGPMAPFRLLTEALMSLLHSGAPLDVSQLGPYRPILARIVPDWGTPAPGQDGGSVVILAEAVRRLTRLAGQDRGCLVLLDDLQNADTESLVVVDYLVENLHTQRTLMLGTTCDEPPGPALDLARSAVQRGSAALLELRRLTPAEIRQLCAGLLDCEASDIPDELAHQLWADSGGVPLLVVEILNAIQRSKLLVRAGGSRNWQLKGRLRTRVTGALTRTMAARLDQIGSPGRDVLSLAAVLGLRFPVSVMQAATGLGYRELLQQFHAEIIAQVVAPDEETPDWYAFQHPLVVDALLTLLSPQERKVLARRAADAVETVFPGLPGEWCQVSAALRLTADEPGMAGKLFAEAGRRALAQGAANTAVILLDKAMGLLGRDDMQARADALASLLFGLAEAGQVERAVSAAAELDDFAGLLSGPARAQLHTRLAWAAAVAGQSAVGLAQVDIARRLLGPHAADRNTAPVDVVAAHLVLDLPGPDQVRLAEQLARRAADVAEAADKPLVACQAWQLLGALIRSRDPQEATACLERARRLAVLHGLPIEEIHALIRLGNDEALRDGSTRLLEQAQTEASRVGAVTARFQAEASLAFQMILRGEFTVAEQLLDQVLESTLRLRLLETTKYALLLRAILGAHRGRRQDMEAAFAELRSQADEHPQHTPRVHGLARAWCALLEEDRPLANEELAQALAAEERSPTVYQLTGRYGIHLLLRSLDGELDRADFQAVVAAPVSQLRWDRQFALYASAVLNGRARRAEDAAADVEQARRAGAPYATGRNLGLRLVSEAAIAHGWGTPVEWLREAEEYFYSTQVTAVASACRALMRQAGVRVTQRRAGTDEIPAKLRSIGVTRREFEVLRLLTQRLSNREIAVRLHLSPRTVEKHVAALLTKTGLSNRIALGEFER